MNASRDITTGVALDTAILYASKRTDGKYDLTTTVEHIFGLAALMSHGSLRRHIESVKEHEFYAKLCLINVAGKTTSNFNDRAYYSTLVYFQIVNKLFSDGYQFYTNLDDILLRVQVKDGLVIISFTDLSEGDSFAIDIWELSLINVLAEVRNRIDWIDTGNDAVNYPVRVKENIFKELKDAK